MSSPNVWSSSHSLPSGTVVTLFRAVPGDTPPRMQVRFPGGKYVDCGRVENPERFGPFGTYTEFQAWSRQFAAGSSESDS